MPLRTGKLDPISFCRYPSNSVATIDYAPSTTLRPLSDEDDLLSAFDTLSTPFVSPMIIPRVITDGRPASSTDSSNKKNDDDAITSFRPGRISDYQHLASRRWLSHQHIDLAPGSESPGRVRHSVGAYAFVMYSIYMGTKCTKQLCRACILLSAIVIAVPPVLVQFSLSVCNIIPRHVAYVLFHSGPWS